MGIALGRDIAVRLFANEQDRTLRFIPRPDGIIKHHPAEHRDNDRGDVGRHARNVDDRDWLAVTGQTKNAAQEVCHRISDHHARKHKGVARIGFDFLNLGFDAHIRRILARFVELAHFSLNDRSQIGEEIGHGRINRQLRNPFGNTALGARCEQSFRQNVGINLPLITLSREEHFAMLFKIHQPIGHRQIANIEQRTVGFESGRIFAVGIDHHDVALRRKLTNPVEDQRSRGRFTRTSRTKQREMLAEHRINIKRTAHIRGWIDRTDFDIGMIVRRVKLTHIFRGSRVNQIIRTRIAGDPATEIIDFARKPLFIALTQKVDHRDDVPGRIKTFGKRADVGDQPCRSDFDLNLTAYLSCGGKAWIACHRKCRHRLRTEQHTRCRTRNIKHRSNMRHLLRRNRGTCRRIGGVI